MLYSLISFKRFNVLKYNLSLRAMSSRCDVRFVESEDNIRIAFKYISDSSLQRYFHFKRNKSETLRQTFARISLNINNLNKKLKRKTKTKSNVETEPKLIDIQLIVDGINISDDSLNSDIWKSGQVLRISENSTVSEYKVFLNAPTVNSIRLPKSIMSSFKVYPIVSLEFCSLNDCKFVWFRQHLSNEIVVNSVSKDIQTNKSSENIAKEDNSVEEWIRIGEEFYYNTSCADIGCKLKVICYPNNGIESEAISENVVEANPGLCPFEERHLFCKTRLSSDKFRIISYNILADIYANSDYSRTFLFPYCPPYALSIDYRKQLLIKEIIGYNADICCLQEVDAQVFDNDLNPIMSSLLNETKYESLFSEKGETGEGLATFYNTSKFELLSAETVVISQEVQSNPIFKELLTEVSANEKLRDRLFARYSVFQCILLKCREESDRTILVGNTHMYFHPDADHIRLIQSYVYVKYMENVVKRLAKTRPDFKVSPILCGDFNSCPEFGVLKLMTTGFVPKDIEDFKSNSDETIEGFNMSHGLTLGSACGQPLYTNYTPLFSGCLDYIFYDTNTLNVSEVIPFPSHETVVENIAIPSVVFPSDHLPLVCVLQLNNI